jgi:DUF1680 family protein
LRVREPAWAAAPLEFTVNGKAFPVSATPGTYASITRQWKKGDRLAFRVPMTIRTEALHGSPDTVAFLYGPLVLAGDLGPEPTGETIPYAGDHVANLGVSAVDVPLLSADLATIGAAVQRVPGQALTFITKGIGKPADVTLRPFADLHYERYNVYWKVSAPTP